jgi:mannonate dehydratase
VVESLPVHEDVKIGEGDLETDLRPLPAVAAQPRGLRHPDVVCYNFMPVLDWTRTELAHPLPGGGTALRFNLHEYVAVDHFMLERPGAARGPFGRGPGPGQGLVRALERGRSGRRLLANIMAGLPGAYDRYDVPGAEAHAGPLCAA